MRRPSSTTGSLLDRPRSHEPGLLSALYRTKTFEPDAAAAGIHRYQSERLGRVVGLPNLWVAFNGYWPEQGAELQTTTFKDLEARDVLALGRLGHGLLFDHRDEELERSQVQVHEPRR